MLDSLKSKTKLAEAKDIVSSVLITTKKEVEYGDLISIMDILRKEGLANIGLVPTKGW